LKKKKKKHPPPPPIIFSSSFYTSCGKTVTGSNIIKTFIDRIKIQETVKVRK